MDEFNIPPQAIIFAVIMIIGFVRNILFKKGGNPTEEEHRHEDPNDPMAEFRRMIEQAREEANENERTSSPPPVIQRAPSPAPRPQAPPKLVTTPPPPTSPPPVSVAPQITKAPKPNPAPFPHSAQKRVKRTQNRNNLKALLDTPESARQAIILSEVLGKPKSLQ